MRREKTGYDRHTTEEGCKFAQTILPPPHLKAVWVGKQIMSEVRKEIRTVTADTEDNNGGE